MTHYHKTPDRAKTAERDHVHALALPYVQGFANINQKHFLIKCERMGITLPNENDRDFMELFGDVGAYPDYKRAVILRIYVSRTKRDTTLYIYKGRIGHIVPCLDSYYYSWFIPYANSYDNK